MFGVADDDLLIEEDAEPFGGVFVGPGEGERAGGNFAAIARDGEGDFSKPLELRRADEMGSLASEMNAMCDRLMLATARVEAIAVDGKKLDEIELHAAPGQ